ncbi:MAG TPA: hypothetical protein VHM19_10715 [Polyangiales bacterium]|jgi:hypothetical protein|nr:hypothetical protein [Polyangiales bacterium]
MNNDLVRRSIYRQGFVILLIAFFMGFGIIPGGPQARGWMATHMSLLINAAIVIAVGVVWNDLALSDKQRRILRFSVVFDAYWNAAAGAWATLLAIPGPATGGGVQPSPGWATTVFFTVFIPAITILPFVFTGLVIYGLRPSGAKPASG